MEQAHRVKWVDSGREPQLPPNPSYPKGIDLDASYGADKTCKVALPYPAMRCGHYHVKCRACGATVAVSTAGRIDDPTSVRMACKRANDVN